MTAIHLAELPGHRLADVMVSTALVVLPTGSIEYHGPHGSLAPTCTWRRCWHSAWPSTWMRCCCRRAFLTLPAGPRAYTGTIDIAEHPGRLRGGYPGGESTG